MFVNGKEIYKFTVKDSKINPYELCLGNISKDWLIDNIKKASLKGYVFDFSVDYDAISVAHIIDIHKYLMDRIKWSSTYKTVQIHKTNICFNNDLFW